MKYYPQQVNRVALITFSILLVFSAFISGCGKTSTESSPQQYNGVLTGRVLDGLSAGPLSGATISLFNGKNVAVSDFDGNFEIDSLPIGYDKLTITKSGYSSLTDSVFIITDKLTTYTALLQPSMKGWITSWQILNSGTTEILTNACYATTSTIYVCGFNGTLLRSSDGGTTWAAVQTGISENLYCVNFSDANRGVIMGNNGTILFTTNGGSSWTTINGNGYQYRNASFTDGTHGLAVGGNGSQGPAIMKTNDGGLTWTDLSSNLQLNSKSLYGVAAPSLGVFYIGSAAGEIFKSTDAGNTWVEVQQSGEWCHSLAFTSTSSGYYSGTNGFLSRTTDGAFSWGRVGPVISETLNCVRSMDIRHLTAVGDNGTIIHSRSSGNSWITQTISALPKLYNVASADSVHAVIVGENGTILGPVIQ